MKCKDRFHSSVLAICGLGMLLASASSAAASGFWNTPSNICQWAGYGNGGGYHAPFVLGPADHCHGLFRPNIKRFPQAPTPPYDCCYGGCSYEGGETMPEFVSQTSGTDEVPQRFTPPANLRMVRLPPVQPAGF